ncbi:MAG: DMT family transporter [Anaerolineales bacterium]|nr:DMT family transporter [Anaerolineales bacterium]
MNETNKTPADINEVTYPSLKLKAHLMQKMRLRGINAALLSAVFLGLAPVFGKAAMVEDTFSPFAVVALRTSIAALLLMIILAITNRRALYIYPAALYMTLLAGGINGFGSIFYYIGLSRLNASVAQLLYSLYPFFVAFWLQLDRQPPSRLTILRIGIAIVGVFFLTRGAIGILDPLGVIFMLVAAALYALHLPINQRALYDVPAPTVTVYTLLAMSAIVVPAYLIFDGSLPGKSASWTPVLALTAVTFFSRLTLFLGVKHIGGMQTALLGLAELIVAIVFSRLILGENFTRLQWIGMIGLGFSLLLVWFEKPPPRPPPTHGLLGWLQPPDFPTDFYKH